MKDTAFPDEIEQKSNSSISSGNAVNWFSEGRLFALASKKNLAWALKQALVSTRLAFYFPWSPIELLECFPTPVLKLN